MVQTLEPTYTKAPDNLSAQFDRDGYLVIRGLFSPDEIGEIRDAFTGENSDGPVPGLSEINSEYPSEDPLSRYPRMMNPHLHSDRRVGPVSMKHLLSPRLESILTELMREEPVAIQSMFYFKPPGARGQAPHQDNYYLRVKPGTCMAAWMAVDDADKENGGMIVVPGSQEFEVSCPQKADTSTSFTTDFVAKPEGFEELGVDLKAGDVLFFNGSLIHGSYPNTSKDRFRRALIFHYAPKGSVELAHWYSSPMTFAKQPLEIPAATGGGPCGTAVPMTGPH